MIHGVISFDRTAILWVRQRRRPSLTAFLKFISYSGNPGSWLGAAAVLQILLLLKIRIIEMQEPFLHAMLCALLATTLGTRIKRAVARSRPFQAIEDFRPLVRSPLNDSFPSSHTASSVAFFVALLLTGHPAAAVVGVWAALVSFSRLYLGVHFPSDLAGGLVLGCMSGYFIFPIERLLIFFRV